VFSRLLGWVFGFLGECSRREQKRQHTGYSNDDGRVHGEPHSSWSPFEWSLGGRCRSRRGDAFIASRSAHRLYADTERRTRIRRRYLSSRGKVASSIADCQICLASSGVQPVQFSAVTLPRFTSRRVRSQSWSR